MKKFSSKKKVIISLLLTILLIISFIGILYLRLLVITPEKYLIQTPNTISVQSKNECMAYAAAYVMRHLGDDVDSKEFYKSIDNKMPDGSISGQTLVEELESLGYKVSVKSGTILKLKNEISKGNPVLVHVSIAPGSKYTHLLPLVGYDSDHFFAAESSIHYANASSEYYNRSIEIEDFKKMWKVEGTSLNTYIVIKK